MRHQALGLVEVRGYLGAVAAADAALKAAAVTCLGVEVIKGGLVTVKLGGDVGAVQAAVDAGAELAVQLDVLITRHVIARLHEETAAMVAGKEEERPALEQVKKAEMPAAAPKPELKADMKQEAELEAVVETKADDQSESKIESKVDDKAPGKADSKAAVKADAAPVSSDKPTASASSEASTMEAEKAAKPAHAAHAAKSATDAMQRVAREAAKVLEEARKADGTESPAKDDDSKPRVKPPKAPSAAKKRSKGTKKA
ncbi:BMC domain-containing protein [Paenibacillus aquistagni]|uniref:BMC domain-containing protein n=1 Tax=Paenibacillus aquistagni TaxID=1852522 RepID=UPI00145B6489|nr:BMC domain-containing protein [Paenibacillus aquistagni]NMM53316.1 BMC domain-containing protein [Paenibacillus aquistagni]